MREFNYRFLGKKMKSYLKKLMVTTMKDIPVIISELRLILIKTWWAK